MALLSLTCLELHSDTKMTGSPEMPKNDCGCVDVWTLTLLRAGNKYSVLLL